MVNSRLVWPKHWRAAPTFATARSDRPTRGGAVARVARYLGGALRPMQRYVADVMSEVDPKTGEWWYDKCVIIAPRRSGKTFMERALVTERCSASRTRVLMTAQTRDLAADRWADIVYAAPESLEAIPDMKAMLHITKGNSNELCEWPNGSLFRPFAPLESAIHGDEPDMVWITEFWWFGLDTKRILQNAYRPVWSVKPGQEVLESAGGTSRSLWLKSERSAGRESTFDPLSRTAYFEWSLPGAVDELMSLDDEDLVDLVFAHHPEAGNTLRRGFLLSELRDPEKTRADFLRAYGSIDADDATTSLVIPARWKATSTLDQIPNSSTGVLVGVGVAVDARGSAVCAAWCRPDGVTQVEVVASQPGQAWVPGYVASMPGVSAVAVSGKGMGQKVLEACAAEGLETVKFSGTEAHTAGTDFVARLVEEGGRSLVHTRDGRLDGALPHAKLSAGSGVVSADGELVVSVQAAVAAVWAAEHAPEPAVRRPFWLV